MHLSLLVAAASTSSALLADWQFTKWGMTPEEVALISKGSAAITNEERDDSYVGNRGKFSGGTYQFDAEYVFKASGLSKVSLKLLSPGACSILASDLRVKYGAPVSVQSPIPTIKKTIWSDLKEGNKVELSMVRDSCFVNYSPLSDPSLNAL
jgi:hypothetical protein